MRILVPALLAVSLLAPLARAQDAPATPAAPAATAKAKTHASGAVFTPAPSGWYVEVRGGFATQDYGDMDANITAWEQIAEVNLGAPGPFRRFDNPQAYAIEIGRRRGPWSLGLSTEHQRQRVNTFAAGTITGAADATTLVATMDIRLSTSWRPASLFGFEFGASGGMSFAHVSEDYAFFVFPAPEFDQSISGAYHASSFSGGPHVGWRRPLFGNTWLVARGAWVYRKFDELKGQAKVHTADGTEIVDTPLLRFDSGEKVKIDGSGTQLTAGVAYTFGGKR